MAFGEKLRELRLAAGWTQAELANRSGVNLATLRGIEQAKAEPVFANAAKLAAALGVSLDQFVEVKPAVKKSRPK